VELVKSHSSNYIESLIKEELQTYGIDIKQIISLTVDNGRNMVKLGENIRTSQNNSILIDRQRELLDDYFNNQDENDEESEDEIDGNQEEIIREEDVIISDLHKLDGLMKVIRCSAHTLQLAVIDVTKELSAEASFRQFMEKARRIVKAIKSSTYVEIVKQQKLKLPKLDVITRWMSSFIMLKSLFDVKDNLKAIYESVKKSELLPIYLDEKDWEKIENYLETFKPIYLFTKELQETQLTIS
jgi:hypothetical protein